VPEEEILTDAERVLRFAAKRPLLHPLPPHFLEGVEGGSAEDAGGDTGGGEGGGEEGYWVRRPREEDCETWVRAAWRAGDVEGTGMISWEAFTALQGVLDAVEGGGEGEGGVEGCHEVKGPIDYREFLTVMMAT
jgi:hypothetical protein